MQIVYNIFLIFSTIYNLALVFMFNHYSQSNMFTSTGVAELLTDGLILMATNIVVLFLWLIFEKKYELDKESLSENNLHAGLCFSLNCILIGVALWHQLGI